MSAAYCMTCGVEKSFAIDHPCKANEMHKFQLSGADALVPLTAVERQSILNGITQQLIQPDVRAVIMITIRDGFQSRINGGKLSAMEILWASEMLRQWAVELASMKASP